MDLSSFLASVSDNAANLDGAGVTLWSSFLGFIALFIAGASLTRRVGKKAKLEDVTGAWGIAFLWGLLTSAVVLVTLGIQHYWVPNLWLAAATLVGGAILAILIVLIVIVLEGPNSPLKRRSNSLPK